MQKFLSMAKVQAIVNPEKEMFTREELIAIKVSMQFIQEKFYWQEEDNPENKSKEKS